MELEAFVRHFRQTFPGVSGSKMVVALSGGADSTALLHLLLRSDLNLTLHAVHVHHGARGDEADEDAQFCRALCQELDVAYSEIILKDHGSQERGREASWRTLRYAALERTATEVEAHSIATAHHRDDVAEGVIMQLLRGAGPRAMAGIHSRDQRVIRPLLAFSGGEIRAWLVQHGLPWREDSSNQSPDHLRNRVRHEVLPFLEGIAPSVRSHLNRVAGALADIEECLALDLEKRDLWIDPWHPDGGVPVGLIDQLPRALQVHWLHSQVARVGLPRATHRQGALLQDVLSGATPALTLARRWVLRRVGGLLWLDGAQTIPTYQVELHVGSTAPLPIPGWTVTLRELAKDDTPTAWKFPVSSGDSITIRCIESDDRLEDGRRAITVLRTFLPRHLRRIWPILFNGDKLLWIPGVKAGDSTVGGPLIVEVTRK